MLKKPVIILIFDVLLINLCIISIFNVRFFGGTPSRNWDAYLHTWYLITAVFILLNYVNGLYDFDETDDGVSIFFKIFSVAGVGTISLMALTFLSRAFAFPRTVIMMSYLMILLSLSVWRLFIHKKFLESLPPRRAVVYGNPKRFEMLSKFMKKSIRKYEYCGGIEAGNFEEIMKLLEDGRADCVVITDDVPAAQDFAMRLYLKYKGLMIYMMPTVANVTAGMKYHLVLGDVPLVSFSHKTIIGRLYLMKRIIDITLSAIALTVATPVLILVAIGIKATSKGPIFYSQPRVGRHGKLFDIIKFRTMVENAEEITGPMLSTGEDDPRVTAIGRILRRFKIDEFPQFFNVLKGDMSIVGPRPERPVFVEEFEQQYPGYTERKKVLPGITGLAQVNGKYETDVSIKMKYDLLYIHNYHPLMDFAIMYKTFQFVARENI